jgi:hypothetical protein
VNTIPVWVPQGAAWYSFVFDSRESGGNVPDLKQPLRVKTGPLDPQIAAGHGVESAQSK